jgi:hypothetical protein
MGHILDAPAAFGSSGAHLAEGASEMATRSVGGGYDAEGPRRQQSAGDIIVSCFSGRWMRYGGNSIVAALTLTEDSRKSRSLRRSSQDPAPMKNQGEVVATGWQTEKRQRPN